MTNRKENRIITLAWEPYIVVQERALVAEKERMLWLQKTKINKALNHFLFFQVTLTILASQYATGTFYLNISIEDS